MADVDNTADGADSGSEDVTPQTDQNTSATDQSKDSIPAEVKNALKKANKEAETLRLKLKEFEDRDKTDAQKLQEERDALKAERDSLQMAQLRREVADEKGLTPAQAKRLVGSTREELETDAEDIVAAFPSAPPKPKFGDVGQGPRGGESQRTYTRTEIGDFSFFTKHKEDILAAVREGRISDE